jgi:magnesium-transporting ATPase (P-type)
MSVITRNLNTGKIQLLTKGADSVIEQLLAPDQKQNLNSTMQFVNAYARNGLRTLLLAVKDLDEMTYANWN